MAGKTIKTRAGREIEPDGDVIPILDALYQDIAVASGFEHSYLDMRKEIEHLVEQLTPRELRGYFMSSLFLNVVTYENQMAERILRSISGTKAAQRVLSRRSSPRAARPVRRAK